MLPDSETKSRALYVKTLLPAVMPAARLLSGVDDAQVQELAQSFAKENKKQKDKELGGSQDEQLRKRTERTIDFLENLVGGFTDKPAGKDQGDESSIAVCHRHLYRQREDNQARLIELLRNKKGEEEIAAFLKQWLYTPEAITQRR